MRPLEYARPETLEQASELLADGGTPLAGGTDLLALLKDDAVTASRLVDLKGLPGLEDFSAGPEGFRIGALARLADLAREKALVDRLPALASSFDSVGGPQIRNRGTLGGNLLQRPRCWYFRRGFGLVPVRDGRSMVREGDNRFHAVFGTDGEALFVTPSTVVPLLVALGAEAEIHGREGVRRAPVAELYRSPDPGERELHLEPGEILTAVEIPDASDRTVASYEVRPGESLDWSLATASVVLRRSGATVRESRIVLGQVAPTPWRSRAAEEALAGGSLSPDRVRAAAQAAVAEAEPLSMNEYKVQLARVAVERALHRAAGREVPS
ncbi:MAG: FAD binding domain-containing protein [Thermoanaerobaculia bacterium]|nr:FAD binding domain-containing protein [Thermoanaerobaculia bacterium]